MKTSPTACTALAYFYLSTFEELEKKHDAVFVGTGAGVSLTGAANINSFAATMREPQDRQNAAPQVNAIDLRNNIFANTQTVGTRYAVYVASASGAAVFSDINYNDYFASNIGFLSAARPTLADW